MNALGLAKIAHETHQEQLGGETSWESLSPHMQYAWLEVITQIKAQAWYRRLWRWLAHR